MKASRFGWRDLYAGTRFLVPLGEEALVEAGRAAGLREGTTLLELACGNGTVAIFLAEEFHAYARGVDASAELVADACRHAERSAAPHRVRFVHEDPARPPDGPFDVVCALREPARGLAQPSVKLLEAIRFTLRNKPFLIVLLVNVIVLLGLATMMSLGLYVNIYYVFEGDKAAAAKLSGISGSLVAGLSYVSVWLATVISTRLGKRRAAEFGLAVTLIGTITFQWTFSREYPFLQLISAALVGLGLQGCWMLFISMIGDVCEEDELQTGLRREGVYSAVGGFSRKAAVAAAGLGSGLILKLVGFDAEVAEASGAPEGVVQRLKLFFILGQATVLIAGIVLLRFYPITRERAEETQRILRARRGGTKPPETPELA